MATESNDSLRARIDAIGLMVGNQVLGSDKNAVTGSRQTWVDSDSRLAVGAQQPFALGATQSTSTGVLFTLSGKAQTDVLTNTLVTGASVTTATKAGFVRVNLTSDDDTFVGGSYYLELFVIT